MLEEWQKGVLEIIEEENINFYERTNSLLFDITAQELSLLEKGIKKINKLPTDSPIYLTLKKQQQALFDHKNSNNEVVFGRLSAFGSSDTYETFSHINTLSGKEVFNFISNLEPSNISFSSKDILINRFDFFCNLSHLCEELYRLKKDQEALNNLIGTLLKESQTLDKNEVNEKFSAILQQSQRNKWSLENFENYNRIFKETYTCIKEFITQNSKLADEVEQALKALLSNREWGNKAVKFIFCIPSTPNNIEKMRIILNSEFSHESKMFKIAKIVKQQAQQPQFLRNEQVRQLYQQLSDMFKQNYPDLWKMDGEQQGFSDFVFYDENSSTKIIETLQIIDPSLTNFSNLRH